MRELLAARDRGRRADRACASQVDRAAVAEAIRAHDVVVIPSLWECWPYAALEPMHLNRPILATPVGGLVELVAPGRSGWLAGGTDPVALEAGARVRHVGATGALEEMVRGGAPLAPRSRARRRARDPRRLSGARSLRSRVAAGAAAPREPAAAARVGDHPVLPRPPLRPRRGRVAARADATRRSRSCWSTTARSRSEDWIVAELAARLPVAVVSQMNQGLGAARNFGVAPEPRALRVPARLRQHRRARSSSLGAWRSSSAGPRSRT